MDWSSASEITRAVASLGDAVAVTTNTSAETRRHLARALHLTGDVVSAMKTLKDGLETPNISDNDRCLLQTELVEYLTWTGRNAEAASAAESSLARAMSIDAPHKAAAESALGTVALSVGNNHRARERFEAAVRAKTPADVRAKALIGLSGAYLGLGQLPAAAAMAKEATELANNLGFRWLWATARTAEGRVRLAEGTLSSAREAIQAAHHQCAELIDRPGVTVTLLALADLALRRKRYQPARNLYTKVLKHGAKLGWRRGAILGLQGIAITHLGGDEPATAARLLHQAKERASNLGYPHLIADLGSYLVDCYVALDRPERRIDVRHAYLLDLEAIDDQASMASQWSAIGTDCEHVRRFEDAREAWQNALAISRQRHDTWAQAVDLANLAGLEKRLGNNDRWRELVNEALSLAPADTELAQGLRNALG